MRRLVSGDSETVAEPRPKGAVGSRFPVARAAALAVLLCVLAGPGCKRRDPVRLQETDEGTPVLLSTLQMADPKAAIQLLEGFHAVEHDRWRWTAGKFSVTLKPPAGAEQKGATLVVNFAIPEPVLTQLKSTTLTASIGATQLGSATYSSAGDHAFKADVPPSAFRAEAVTVDFSLSNFLPAGTSDKRELGVVMSVISLEPK